MSRFMLVWRDASGVQSRVVPQRHGQGGLRDVDVTATSTGVRVNGIDIAGGMAARVDGVVMSCLAFRDSPGGCGEVGLGRMVGASSSTIETMHMVAAAGLSREPVLILGESGTGKELAAEYLGGLAGGMLALNLGAIPPDLAEAELFGWTRGAFTGAVDPREGALEAAGKGVLFLDEVAEAPAWVQVKLLRAIDSRRFCRLGSKRETPLLSRLVAATNVDPVEGVASGRLRLDLLERLACHVIRLAPLRSRPADLPCLVNLFAARDLEMRSGPVPCDGPSADVIDLLRRWPWPGNVRELKNVVTRVLMVSSDGLKDVALVREALDAGRFFRDEAGQGGESATRAPSTRKQEIEDSAVPRSTYYYRLKRGKVPSDTGPRRAPSSAALKT